MSSSQPYFVCVFVCCSCILVSCQCCQCQARARKKNVWIYLQRKLARCWYFFDFGWLFRCWKRFELSVGIQRKRKFYICFVCCLFAFVQLITPFKRIIDFDAFALVMRREKIFPHYFCHCCFDNFRFFQSWFTIAVSIILRILVHRMHNINTRNNNKQTEKLTTEKTKCSHRFRNTVRPEMKSVH